MSNFPIARTNRSMRQKFSGLLLSVLAGGYEFCLTPLGAEEASVSASAPIEILVDGKPLATTPAGFQIPASHKNVSVRLGTPAESEEESRRMRFRLEGVDTTWRQIPSEMSLMVRFGNGSGDQVGQHTFRVIGISDGWKGMFASGFPHHGRDGARPSSA